jgi:hypothetical protein
MTAPRRIIDDPSVHEDIRDVVRNVRGLHPDYDVAGGVARFDATLGAMQAADVAKSAGVPLATKLLVVAAVFGVGIGVTYTMVGPRSAPSIEVPSPRAAIAPPTNLPELRPSAADVPSMSVDALPSVPTPSTSATAVHPAAREVSNDREREVRHLVELQRMAASDPASAILLAKAGHAEFPRGALYQEREIILVDALVQKGQAHEAGQRAKAFVKAYPKSPAAPHMRAIADAEEDAPTR